MKLSLKWLRRHVDLEGLEPRRILDDLTMSTAEIEGLQEFGAGLEHLVVGRVVASEPHPDADRLTVNRVDLGGAEPVPIVCGAPNVAAGQLVVVVQPGQRLPGHDGQKPQKVKKARIRGVESFGMICSERELGLSDEHAGILVLDEGPEPGAPLLEAVPLKDHVFEIDNKSINHRPDLWGHYGFARELAAIYGRELAPLPRVEFPGAGQRVPVRVEDPAGCPRYVGLVLEGVDSRPSPAWLRWLLQAVGQRPINLVVDLTNFVMLDLGQPMHAFDLRDLQGRTVGVRRARRGETLRTLDGVERRLEEQDLLITADDEPVALAGVMGGEGTMVAEDTTALFLESANFHAATIRRTSMRLGLRTEASARFEKALDPANAELAVHEFAHLLGELCPGAGPAGPLEDPTGWRYEPATIRLRRARLDLKLGVHVPDADVRRFLSGLEFAVADADDGYDVTVPSFRATKDITIEDDLIEEVGRMYRYDNIPEQPLANVVTVPPREEELVLARRAVELAACELHCHEVYRYSFVHDDVVQRAHAPLGDKTLPHVRVRNPVSPETARLRRHVLPGLLPVAADNLRRRPEVRLVEHGRGYLPEERDADGLPRELRELAFVWARREGDHPYGELRQALAVLLERLGHPARMVESYRGDDEPWLHPGRTAAIECGGQVVGHVGCLHPQVHKAFELPAAVAVATVDLRALLRSGRQPLRYRPIPAFPELPVDLALLVDDSQRVSVVEEFLRRAGGDLVRSVRWFETYRGPGLPAGKKSLNFTVTLGAPDRTLTASDEEALIAAVRRRAGEIGGELRG